MLVVPSRRRAVIKAFTRQHHSLLPHPPGLWRHGFELLDIRGNVRGVACWSHPTATLEDQAMTLELLRMTLLDCPPNTATWMLGQMRAWIRGNCPHITRLISYSDPERHHGTMYRADNWTAVESPFKPRPRTHRVGRTPLQERSTRMKWERRP